MRLLNDPTKPGWGALALAGVAALFFAPDGVYARGGTHGWEYLGRAFIFVLTWLGGFALLRAAVGWVET